MIRCFNKQGPENATEATASIFFYTQKLHELNEATAKHTQKGNAIISTSKLSTKTSFKFYPPPTIGRNNHQHRNQQIKAL